MTSVNRLRLALVGLAFIIVLPLWAEEPSYDQPAYELDIEPQPLAKALKSFAEQSGLQVVYYSELASGEESPEVSGTMTADQAMTQLLASTDLTFDTMGDDTVVIEVSDAVYSENSSLGNFQAASSPVLMAQNQTSGAKNQSSQASRTKSDAGEEDDNPLPLEEIIVTGTNIRGAYPDSSPVLVFDAEEIRRSGVSTTEQFFQTLPQNISTLVSSGSGALGGAGESNVESVNTIDLRGLGVGTTLILMNGRRIAPSSNGRAPDVSLIPLAAIERVEILTDGASAIYGSDAVGGVVNFILKDQFEGAETTLGIGSVTDGSHSLVRLNQSFGTGWQGGGGLLSYSYLDQQNLDVSDRAFALAAAPFSLIPEDRRHNVLATVTQALGVFDLSADFLFSKRYTASEFTQNAGGSSRFVVYENEQEQLFSSVALSREFSERLYVDGVVTYSTADITVDRSVFQESGDFFDSPVSDTEAVEATISVGGSLLETPGGTLKYAVGIGYGSDELSSTNVALNTITTLDRDTKYAFAELLIPIVQPDQRMPGLNRLEISLANRYTDYSDFGSDSSPKIGLVWSPLAGLNLRGTFAQSFRAPFLAQTDPNSQEFSIFNLAAVGIPDPFSDDDSTVLFFATGSGNPSVGPEEAESFTAGFDFSPPSVPQLTVSATYFEIEYLDQIAEGDPTGGFAAVFAPDQFPDLFIIDPTEEYITSATTGARPNAILVDVDVTDPSAIAAVTSVALDNRVRNLSSSRVSGIDLEFSYRFESGTASVDFGSNISFLLESVQTITPSSPEFTLVDTLLNPADLKLQCYFSYESRGFYGRATANYVDGYTNPFSTTNPNIGSWTTVDIAAGYSFPNTKGVLEGMRLSLSILNLLDEDPPFVAQADVTNTGLNEPVGFDPTNASPLGRFVSLEFSKRW